MKKIIRVLTYAASVAFIPFALLAATVMFVFTIMGAVVEWAFREDGVSLKDGITSLFKEAAVWQAAHEYVNYLRR